MSGDPPTLRHLGEEAVLAAQTVAEAIRLARSVQHDAATGALTKADASPVTIADFAVQALVAARLARDAPHDPLVAEEDATQLRSDAEWRLRARVVDFVGRMESRAGPDLVLDWIDRGGGTPGPRFWTLDPIDGTKGLLRGGQYAIALALVVNGVVELGVLGCPRLSLREGATSAMTGGVRGDGGIAIAVRGRRAWWTSPIGGRLAQLSVSATTDPVRTRVLHSFEAAHSDVTRLDRVLSALGTEAPPMLMDSQAKHVVLAAGDADLLLRFPTSQGVRDTIWDQAAGSLLIEEAGGRVTDLAGRALDFSTGRRLLRNEGLVASNGRLHDSVLAALRSSKDRQTL
jgi:3'(2'), 5'-bisphosphate nucleotidase